MLVGVCALCLAANVAAKEKPDAPCKVKPKASKQYPGDDAPKEALAKWMASTALRARLPAELPVMAALVESGLQNSSFGDADAVGYFQMRVSIWNAGAYAGFAEDPELQLQWFIDQALLVEQQRVADGASIAELLNDDQGYGDWIADVERPAEQFRGRYQLRLDEARGLICA